MQAPTRVRRAQDVIENEVFKSLEDVNKRTKGALLFAPTIATGEGERA